MPPLFLILFKGLLNKWHTLALANLLVPQLDGMELNGPCHYVLRKQSCHLSLISSYNLIQLMDVTTVVLSLMYVLQSWEQSYRYRTTGLDVLVFCRHLF